MSGVTVGFWFVFALGFLTGALFIGFGYVPYQRRRWERRDLEDRFDIARITGGLPDTRGRHALTDPTDEYALSDAVGAFAQAKAAVTPSPYPGPGRTPEPEWVRWVEEHGRSVTRPPKPPRWWRWLDTAKRAMFTPALVGLIMWWRLDRAWARLRAGAGALLVDAQAAIWAGSDRFYPGVKQ